MAITSVATLRNAPRMTTQFYKNAGGAGGGFWFSMWTAAGNPPAGATPTATLTGANCDNTTLGGLNLVQTGSSTYLNYIDITANQACTVLLYDRLWATSGLSPTSIASQSVNSINFPTRWGNPQGNDLELWMDSYSTIGAGAGNASFTYSDEQANAPQAGIPVAYPSAMTSTRTMPLNTLAAGDNGVSFAETVTFSVSRTSGTIGLTVRKLLAIMPVTGVSDVSFDSYDLGMMKIPSTCCLEFICVPTTGTGLTISGTLVTVQG